MAARKVSASARSLRCFLHVTASWGPPKAEPERALTSQNTTVDFLGTGRENLRLQGQLYGHSGAELDSRVAELLGISRKTLYARLKRLDLDLE